ncbi:related to branched-chain alpha-ketoacid dehydrogenase kinase, mitochondrial precursor [Pseudozyma flocculosa]|uniref:Protein-serine/threonine kinase n=1 Tax=Pseudozyma flocculosa TaxID=84751 RepID=A0A5C3F0M4_9BASI|nr:related to branched-chain alpha-ketoacid dehydrogenase kinase, mitochondrial precursor [Pseudozyma flocculosa]
MLLSRIAAAAAAVSPSEARPCVPSTRRLLSPEPIQRECLTRRFRLPHHHLCRFQQRHGHPALLDPPLLASHSPKRPPYTAPESPLHQTQRNNFCDRCCSLAASISTLSATAMPRIIFAAARQAPPLLLRASRRRLPAATRLVSTSTTPQASYFPPPEPFLPPSSSADAEPLYPPPSSFSTFGASPDLLSRYLNLSPAPLTLRQLMAQGGKPGQPPTPQQLLASAQHTQRELPIRLARRVGGFRALPFIVGSNPFISKIARLYAGSFETIAKFGPIQTQEDNVKFTAVLEDLVSAHAQNIPTLARGESPRARLEPAAADQARLTRPPFRLATSATPAGFQESKRYMDARQISSFLDGAIHSRVAIRMIAEQHLALSATSQGMEHIRPALSNNLHQLDPDLPSPSSPEDLSAHAYGSPTAIGIIETQLSPARMTRMCADFVRDLCEATLGSAPELQLEGDLEATYTGVPVHLEYVMTELLKNSYRATTEAHLRSKSPGEMPPVIVTIAQSASHISLRIRDQGGGISPSNLPHIFSYAFTTAGSSDGSRSEEDEAEETGGGPYAMQAVGGTGGDALAEMGKMGLASGLGTLAGLGYGLPMAKIYCEYWKNQSSLDLVSLYGHGCDTFVKLPRHIELSNTVI